MNDEIRKLLEDAELHLDNHNGEYADENRLCLCCGSVERNSVVGIVHRRDCIIMRIREFLRR